MYILLTNDDGISSPSLRILAMTAVSRGHRVLVQGAYFVRIVGEQVNAIRKLIVR